MGSFCILSVFSQPNVITQSFATGLNNPVNIKHAGDDRLFVVEQAGFIKVVNANGTVNSTPFLDIDSQVVDIGGFGDERGLLGMVFHPNYSTNGYFYVNYINNSNNTVISRFTVSADPNVADVLSELVILTITQPGFNHNGGDMAFSPIDGFLYIASGDGGGIAGDPDNNAQNLNVLLGKILRIDVDVSMADAMLGITYYNPTSNPFEGDGMPTADEIWAYGLRNPAKFSFDSANGDLWIADVGQSSKEEINLATSTEDGLNYGWRCYEGNSSFNTTGCPAMSSLTFPVGEYNYGGSPFKCAITGGYRYRGSTYSNFIGLYFFADFCSGEIGYLEFNGATWDMTLTAVTGGDWSAFGEDVNGELYIADHDTGTIYSVLEDSFSVGEHTDSSFKMYPNPTDTELNFQFNNSASKNINIYNILGKRVFNYNGIEADIFKISTKNLAKGLYIVEVLNSSGAKVQKKLIVN